MALETPTANATLAQPVVVGGWAVDLNAGQGSGVDAVDVVAYPSGGGAAIPLGLASYGLARSDIAQTYGSQFTNAGYEKVVRGLAPGTYQIVASARSTVTGTYNQSRSVTVTLTANPAMWVDTPVHGATTNQQFSIVGWAIDYAAATGTGVDAIHVWAYPSPGSGTAPVLWGAATYGYARPDVAGGFGTQFTNAGFSLSKSGIAPGTYLVVVYAHSTVTGTFNQEQSLTITVATSNPTMAVDVPAPNAMVGQPFTVAGWAIDRGAPSGPGVDVIHVYAVSNGGAGSATFVGAANYGGTRPDVGAAFGTQFTNSGYGLTVAGLAPGTYRLDVYARSTVTGTFNQARSVLITVQ